MLEFFLFIYLYIANVLLIFTPITSDSTANIDNLYTISNDTNMTKIDNL